MQNLIIILRLKFYTEVYDSKVDALEREKEIKKWKSRKLIEKLIIDSAEPPHFK